MQFSESEKTLWGRGYGYALLQRSVMDSANDHPYKHGDADKAREGGGGGSLTTFRSDAGDRNGK